jgi:purine catabolism regulator
MTTQLTERIRSLGHISKLINAGSALDEVLNLIVMAVCQRSAWSSGAIMAADEASGYSILVARYDPMFSDQRRSIDRWSLSTSPIRTVLEQRHALVIEDAQSNADFAGYQREARERDYHTVVLLPFSAVDEAGRGLVLSVHAHERQVVGQEEIAFLETVTLLASLAVEKARRVKSEAEQKERLRAVIEVSQAAMQQVLSSEDLDAFTALAADYLDFPFLVVDLTTNRLHPGPTLPLPDGFLSRELLPVLSRKIRESDHGQFDRIERLPVATRAGTLIQPIIAEPCIACDRVLGGIVLLTDRPLEAAAALTAQQLHAALTVLLLRRHIRFEAEAETHAAYFARLFSGEWRDRAAMLAHGNHLGIAVDEPARIAAMFVPATPGSETRRAEIEHALGREMRRLTPGGAVFRDGETIVLFIPEPRGRSRPARKLLEQLLRHVEWLLQSPLTACLSQPCPRLEDYATARRYVEALLSLARKLDRTGIVESRDFGPLARLIALSDADGLRDFVQDTIGQIEQHDQANDGQLLVTIEQYLRQRGRLQATADALGIHVTTMRYRLQRITELFDIEVDDPETRVWLDLALRIRRMVG